MMGGSSNRWSSMNNMRTPHEQASSLLPSSSLVFLQYPEASNFLPMTSWHDNEDLPDSCGPLLLGGLAGEEDQQCSLTHFQGRKTRNWEDQVPHPSASAHMVGVKQESSESGCIYSHGSDIQAAKKYPWSQVLPASSPASCGRTIFSSNMLDFTNSKGDSKHLQPDHSSDYKSTGIVPASKKARVQGPPSGQSTFKVRKEKLGDRITALHQLVCPFGKTDTASVLLEVIGYIRFLQSQIEALSSPYLASGSGNTMQPVQGDSSCIFPEDPGQLLTDNCMKKRGPPVQGVNDEPKKDLRSRGLCLVPVSFTMHIGTDNGADFWASAFGGGFP